VRSLAAKWQRILFACWRDSQPYDEALCIKLRRAKTPLAFTSSPN
jgi:hypothetical protein